MTNDVPLLLLMTTVWGYWSCVAVMVLRSRIKFRTAAGALPNTARERLMWAVWIPNWIAWLVLPPLAISASHPLLALPEQAAGPGVLLVIRWLAAAVAMLSLLATLPCWLRMGSNWSMAVVPGKKTELVTQGMFALVRHPIYALNMLLMIASVIVTATPAMLLVGIMHVILMNIKAGNEERYLLELHGQQYADYCRRTGRFMPWRLAGRGAVA